MADESAQPKPVYLPWTSFQNITDELRGKGLPRKLDRSVLKGKSGSTQAHYLAALRFLGMIDADDVPTERFKAYVTDTEQRPAMMRQIVQEKYRAALDLGTDSTQAELAAQFREYGLDGETGRKAIAFFLNAARFAEIEVSPHWPQTRPGGGGRRNGGTAKVRKRTIRKFSDETPAQSNSDAKSRYIDLLLTKAATDDALDTALLDRIERVLGIDSPSASAPAQSQSDDNSPGGDDG